MQQNQRQSISLLTRRSSNHLGKYSSGEDIIIIKVDAINVRSWVSTRGWKGRVSTIDEFGQLEQGVKLSNERLGIFKGRGWVCVVIVHGLWRRGMWVAWNRGKNGKEKMINQESQYGCEAKQNHGPVRWLRQRNQSNLGGARNCF